MKYLIPLSALIIYSIIFLLIQIGFLPELTNVFNVENLGYSLFFFLFLIILLESIIYIGFYLPGQFIAVLLVTGSNYGFLGVIALTLISILAVTLAATVNYYLGYFFLSKKEEVKTVDYKKLFLSMIHINTLALFMFEQGSKKGPKKLILVTGLLNLPYYFIIIGVTYYFKESILQVAENPYTVFILLIIWLIYSIVKEKK